MGFDGFDGVVGSEPSQVVAGLAGGDCVQIEALELAVDGPQVGVGEPVEMSAEGQQRRGQGMAVLLSEPAPGNPGAGVGGDGFGELVQGVGSGDRVVVESLDAKAAPVGGEADLPQGGADYLDVSRW